MVDTGALLLAVLAAFGATGDNRSAHRLIYNCDANNMFIYDTPPMTPETLYPYIDEVAEAGVTTFFMSPNVGMVMNYPTEVGDFIGEYASTEMANQIARNPAPKTNERCVQNLRSLMEAGYDPLALVLDRAKAKGMEAFISFRLNEVHAVEQDDHLIFSRFWKAHPEWRIGTPGDPLRPIYQEILGPDTHPIVGGWLPGGLNFAVPEVRAHRLAQLRECCERFDIDGLDLDFQRFPMYFKPGEEEAHIATMTAWMAEVRAMVNEAGERRGRPIPLSVRVMARPEQNLAIGLDPVTWAQQGLVDMVIVSHYLRNDFPLPIESYRAVLPEDFAVYGSIEIAPDRETYRNIARHLWNDGADGVMVFNFFATREREGGPPFDVLPAIADPAKLGLR